MDVTFNFTEYESHDDFFIFGDWVGKYTIGDINVRGTRVWFRPPFVKSFDKDSLTDKVKENLTKGKRFPGDSYNIRSESLEEIIQCLISNKAEFIHYYNGDINELLKDNRLPEMIKSQIENDK